MTAAQSQSLCIAKKYNLQVLDCILVLRLPL